MSIDEQSNAFHEVRAILGKLDRSIDAARSKRLEPDQPIRRESTPSHPAPAEPSAELDREIGGAGSERAKTELQKKSATFGRAKPLNRVDRPAHSQWKSTGDDDELIG